MKQKKTRPPSRQGPDVKKEIVHNAVPKTIVPKSMAVGQFFRIVQVVPAAPSFVLLPTALVRTVDTTRTLPVPPTALVRTVDTTQTLPVLPTALVRTVDTTRTLPETVRSNRLQDPDDTLDAKTVERTQNSTDAGVDKTDNRTQKLADAEVDKTDNRTQKLTDAEVDKTDNRTQKLTDAGVYNRTQNSTETRLVGGARNALLLKCSSIGLNVDQHPELMDYLPKDNEYHVCSYKHVSQPYSLDHISFKATLRMTLKTKEDLQVWLKSMADTWRVESVKPCKGKRAILKTVYRCQHNTRRQKTRPPSARVSKNTSCTAKLVLTIVPTVNTNGRLSRSTDPHIPVYPTIVEISRIHNHNVSVAGVVGTVVVEKLTKLFESGHSPSSALDVLKYSPSSALDVLKLYKIFGKTRSAHRRRPASSLPKSQKNKKKEQTDNLMQGQSSPENPSQGDIGTNQEECEAESAADFLCLSVPSDYEEDTEDLVESMIRDISSLRKDPIYSQAIAAMAKQFHHIKSNPSRLLSLFGKGQTSSRRTATRRPDALSPCQPTVTPRPVTKLSSKRRLPSGRQQTHSSPIKRPRMMDLQ